MLFKTNEHLIPQLSLLSFAVVVLAAKTISAS